MKNTALIIVGLVASFCFGLFFKTIITGETNHTASTKQTNSNLKITKSKNMKLGAFSVSLSVKDINASKQFFENLGFTVHGGDIKSNYLIMKNEHAIIGLFQGMFENNILTFNPGWDENTNTIEHFDDIRAIQKQLKNKGVKLDAEADENTSGPASLMLTDPDGNVILLDQHI